MIFFKTLQQFLLPGSFIFILILFGWILFLMKKKRKIGGILIAAGLLLYYLFSITPAADLILLPLENQYQPVQKEELNKADNVVLLLGGRESDVLRGSEILRISNLKNRASIYGSEGEEEDKVLFAPQKSKIIVSGRDPLNPEINEAEEVKEFLRERGILPENIILEDKSRNTFESAKNIKEMLGEEPFFLVTSAYHMPRAMEIFQKMGNKPIPAPSDFKIKKDYDILDFFPNSQNLRKSDMALYEYFGILWYRLKY